MRNMLMVLMVVSCGCSVLFQEHLPSDYRYEKEPRCSERGGWALVDGINLALDGLVATGEATRTDREPDATLIATAVLSGVIDGVSMIAGLEWAHSCTFARAEYDRRQHARAEEEERVRLDRQLHPPVAPTPTQTAEPRGFYCASSPSSAASLCAREREACERARDVAIVAVGDISPCTLVEAAWCFDRGRCATTEVSCEAQRGASGSAAGPCRERR